MKYAEAASGAGIITVTMTHNRPKNADEWASEIVNKLMYVADTAPPVIRDQAVAFKTEMYRIIRDNMELAIRMDREWNQFKKD